VNLKMMSTMRHAASQSKSAMSPGSRGTLS
jgi:hypothetical protein